MGCNVCERLAAGCTLLVKATELHSSHFHSTQGLLGIRGGWGAKQNEDGVSATVCINDGDTHNGPCEQLETKFPILVESLSLIQDSGGAGRHRGGLGIERVVTQVTSSVQTERASSGFVQRFSKSVRVASLFVMSRRS